MSVILGVAGTTGVVVGSVFATRLTEKLADKLADTTIHGTIKSIKTAYDAHAPTSYIRAAKPVKVEPFVMVDESVVGLPYTKDVMVALQRIFSCNYLLAQAAQNEIGGISIAKRMDRFAPDRSLDVATRHFLSMESSDGLPIGVGPFAEDSYRFALPTPGREVGIGRFGELAQYVNGPIVPDDVGSPSTESAEVDTRVNALLDQLSTESKRDKGPSSASAPKSTDVVINESANLAVGQVVDVKIVVEDKEATMPVHIRLRPITVSSAVVAGTFSLRGTSYKMGDRLRSLRVGEIEWKDLFFQTDAVREYRRLAKLDKTGYFRKSYDRANKNFLAHIISGRASVGQMSSIMVTSTDTVKEFENKTGSRLSDMGARQAIMEDSLTMMIAVIDPDHEVVTIYLDSIEEGTDYLISDLKAKGKNDKDDMSSLLNSLLEGRIPGRL